MATLSTVTVTIRGDTQQLVAQLQTAAKNVDNFSVKVQQAGAKADTAQARGFSNLARSFTNAAGQTGVLNSEISILASSVGNVGLAAAGAGIGVGVLAGGLLASIKAAISFESAITRVAKTAGFSAEETAAFSDEILAMSRRIPVATSELANIAAVAGQLGITGARNIAIFTEEIAKLASTTGVSAAELASGLGRIAQVSELPISQIGRLSSVITELGNTSNSTEQEILDITTRLAGVANAIGLPVAALAGISSAVAAVTGDVEASASAVQRTFLAIEEAAQTGGDELTLFANVAGLTNKEFQDLAKSQPERAFAAFVEGLRDVENFIAVLDALELSDVRITKTLLSLAQSAVPVSQSINDANRAALENTATNEEFARSSETTAAKIQLLKNNVNAAAIELGNEFKPAVDDAIDSLNTFSDVMGDSQVSAELLANAIRGVLTPLSLMKSSITDTEATWGSTWNAMASAAETAVNSIITAIEEMIQGLGAGISSIREFAGSIPGGPSALEAIGITDDLAERLKEFELGRVNTPRFSSDQETGGGIGGGIFDVIDRARRKAASLQSDRNVGIPPGLLPKGAKGDALTIEKAISDGIISMFEALELGLSDAEVVALELAAAEEKVAAADFRRRIELQALAAAYPGLTAEEVQFRIGLAAIAENLIETNRTIEQFRLAEELGPELDRLQSRLQEVLGQPTRETLGLQRNRAELEKRRLLILQGGATDDDPRIKAIDREIRGLDNLIRLREAEVEIMRIDAALADARTLTDQAQVTQTQLLTAATQTVSTEFQRLEGAAFLAAVALESVGGVELSLGDALRALAALPDHGQSLIPQLDTGGVVKQTGLAIVDKGERFFNGNSGPRGESGITNNYTTQIYVTANTKNDAEEIARVVEERLIRQQRRSDRRGAFVTTGGGFP